MEKHIPAWQAEAIRNAESMKVFADGELNFIWGRWIEWKAACLKESRVIPPAEFKERLGDD